MPQNSFSLGTCHEHMFSNFDYFQVSMINFSNEHHLSALTGLHVDRRNREKSDSVENRRQNLVRTSKYHPLFGPKIALWKLLRRNSTLQPLHSMHHNFSWFSSPFYDNPLKIPAGDDIQVHNRPLHGMYTFWDISASLIGSQKNETMLEKKR